MQRPLTKTLRLWMKGDLAKIAQVETIDEAGSITLSLARRSAIKGKLIVQNDSEGETVHGLANVSTMFSANPR